MGIESTGLDSGDSTFPVAFEYKGTTLSGRRGEDHEALRQRLAKEQPAEYGHFADDAFFDDPDVIDGFVAPDGTFLDRQAAMKLFEEK